MNNERRKQLDKAIGLLEEAKSIIASCGEEEQESFDNMPEGLQSSERGQKAEASADALNGVVDTIDSTISDIEEAKE